MAAMSAIKRNGSTTLEYIMIVKAYRPGSHVAKARARVIDRDMYEKVFMVRAKRAR
jgi:hypothetical protein